MTELRCRQILSEENNVPTDKITNARRQRRLGPPTQPASELSEGDQAGVVLVQQGEGAVGQRVGVLVGAAGPRHQQPVQTLELGPVEPVLALQVGAAGSAMMPGRRLGRCC